MKKSIIKTADNVEKAIEIGLKELLKTRDEVTIEVLEEGKNGVFGIIGKKEAVVKLSYEDDLLEQEIREDFESFENDLLVETDILNDLDNKNDKSDLEVEKEIEYLNNEIEEISNEEDSLYLEDDYSTQNNEINETTLDGDKEDDEIISEGIFSISDSGFESHLGENSNDVIYEEKEENHKYISLEDEQLLDDDEISDVEKFYRAKNFLETLFSDLGVNARVYGNIDDQNHISLNCKVDKKDIGIAVGKRGQTLEAIEIILRKAINKGQRYPRISLDINNYKKRQDEKVISFASNMAKKVLKNKNSYSFRPMNAYTRKLVHSEVSKYKGLSTHSEGKDPHRYVVIEYIED